MKIIKRVLNISVLKIQLYETLFVFETEISAIECPLFIEKISK